MVQRRDSAALGHVTATLRAAGCVFAEEEAALLLAAAVDDADLARLVARRAAGEPLEHVLGRVDFCGVRLAVGPGAFVPRRRTAVVVREAVAALRGRAGGVLVDLCCGVGAIAAAVRAQVGPGLEVHAADVDPVALAYARANLPGAEVHAGDLWSALPARLAGRVDVVAANAPYVPTDALATMPAEARDHEPHAALDGGRDGLRLHRRVAAGAPRWLAPGGVLVLETSRPQAEATLAAVAAAGLRARVVTDDATDGTAVVGRLPDERGEPVEELGLRGDDELAGPRERQPRDAVELGEDGAAP